MKLRPFQNELVDEARGSLRDHRRALIQSATGSGKTVMFCELASRAMAKGKHVRIIVHRVEILEQTIEKLQAFGIDPDIIGTTPGWQGSPIAVGMVMTAKKHGLGKCHLIIVDECHHAAKGTTWSDVLSAAPTAYVVGLTATPKRLDGKGLKDHFDVMVQGPSVSWLIDQGYLADIDAWADPSAIVSGVKAITRKTSLDEIESAIGGFVDNLISKWKERGRDERTIAFLPSVRAGEFAAERFREAGVIAESVDGNMNPAERSGIMSRYGKGETQVLVNCQLIDEGVDVPETGCIVLGDSTESLTRHFQRIGRGMRPKKDGRSMVLLDMAGNVMGIGSRKGLGLPTDVVEWTLDGKAKTQQQVDREREKAEEEQRQAEAIAEHSGTVERIVTCLEDARTFKQARRFIKSPDDFKIIKKNCRTKTAGKMYSDAFLLRACSDHFYGDLPLNQGLRKAADDMGKRPYVERAIASGWAWTTSNDSSLIVA